MSSMLLLYAVKTKERRGGIMFVIQISKNYFLGEKRNTINIEDAKRFSSKKEADSKLKETWKTLWCDEVDYSLHEVD